jgi:curved DNA-binding protein
MFGGNGFSRRNHQVKYRGENYQSRIELELADAYKTQKQIIKVNGKNIRITIPAGIENEQTIKIIGHGGAGVNSGPNGDLFIIFSIALDPKIKRLGDNLYTPAELNLYTALLGGELIVNTLTGKVKLNIKPETQSVRKIRLKGKGFPVYKQDGQVGDLFVELNVKIPTQLTPKQVALFTELSEL